MNRPLGFLLFTLVSVHAVHRNILSDSYLKELEADDHTEENPKADSHRLEDKPCTAPYLCLDCHTPRVCHPTNDTANPYQHVRFTNCTGQFPYCNGKTGTCDSEVTDICGEKDEDFICMGMQQYPDPDCKIFHVCDSKYKSHKYQCLVKGENYNAATGSCEPNAACGTFDCRGREGTKVAHSIYKRYYAYCRGEDETPTVDSCNGNYELNSTSQECEPVCKHDGLLQDLEDCHSYYQCTRIFKSKTESFMWRERKTCPENQGFNPQTFQCVPTGQLPSDVHCRQ